MVLVANNPTAFLREFYMSRHKFNPSDYGIPLEREEFTDQMADCFNEMYHGQWTIDEMLLHPRESLRFCDEVRKRFGYFDVPDDIILRVILTRRKNP